METPAPRQGVRLGVDCGLYEIWVRGRLGEVLLDAFSPLVATVSAGRTVLRGPIEDQAALFGVLVKVQSLGLELDEVRHAATPIGDDATADNSAAG